VSATEETRRGLREVAPGLWTWARPHPEFHPPGFAEVRCYVLRDDVGAVVVDPLVSGPDDELLAELDGIVAGRLRIAITIPYHVRSAELLWQRYRDAHETHVYGHPKTGERLSDRHGFRVLEAGVLQEGDLLPHAIGRPRRTEMPLWLPSHEALAFGDAVIEVGGKLRVWDDPLDSDRRERWYRERLLPSLEALLVHDVRRVLVTHGEPVLRDGSKALQHALALPPWTRRGG
jgi:glyoxylase-like metal-dependent hydrolase (beta-lactamase superfamily II)